MMTSIVQIVLFVLVFLAAYFIGFYRGSQVANRKAVAELDRIFKGARVWDGIARKE